MSEAWRKVKLSILFTSIFVPFYSRFVFLPEDPHGSPVVTVVMEAEWQLAFWLFPALILCGDFRRLAWAKASYWPVDCNGIPPCMNSFFVGTQSRNSQFPLSFLQAHPFLLQSAAKMASIEVVGAQVTEEIWSKLHLGCTDLYRMTSVSTHLERSSPPQRAPASPLSSF